ncbi:MAG: GNAT family N-acetyltransferase [Coriobacteriia bacterium]|nr:GNAT family N-acetyltransferase [Coriobacteriia bacterium]
MVTEDKGIHAKARRLELDNRVLTVNEAVSVLRDLYDTTPETPPLVRAVTCHELDSNDPIWESFREEYERFDEWLSNCKRKGRRAWVVEVGTRYAGVAIVKADQDPAEYGLAGKTIKLCSLKVCDDFNGNRYGELLLRAVFDYAFGNSFENIIVTVFPNHWLLIGLLEEFGFNQHSINSAGEQVRLKRLTPSPAEVLELDGLEFHIQFGPQAAKLVPGQTYVVPIQPRFHRQLFPELEMAALDGCQPCGNSMRKAYLSHSGIRSIEPGAVLLFYRSDDWRAVDVIGVVESTLRSANPDDIARFVGKSTVFDYHSIEQLCTQGELLAVLFRQVVALKPSGRLIYRELVNNGVLRDVPQTIQAIAGGEAWLTAKIQRLY